MQIHRLLLIFFLVLTIGVGPVNSRRISSKSKRLILVAKGILPITAIPVHMRTKELVDLLRDKAAQTSESSDAPAADSVERNQLSTQSRQASLMSLVREKKRRSSSMGYTGDDDNRSSSRNSPSDRRSSIQKTVDSMRSRGGIYTET